MLTHYRTRQRLAETGIQTLWKYVNQSVPRSCDSSCDTVMWLDMWYCHVILSCDTVMWYCHVILSCDLVIMWYCILHCHVILSCDLVIIWHYHVILSCDIVMWSCHVTVMWFLSFDTVMRLCHVKRSCDVVMWQSCDKVINLNTIYTQHTHGW